MFEENQLLLAARPATRTSNRVEQAAAEVLGKELAKKYHGAILLFEDSGVRMQNFLVRLPNEVLVISTSEFLSGLEAMKLLPSAMDVLKRATALRGNEVLERHRGGTVAKAPEAWPTRLQRSRP